ncbi:membrane protein [Gemmobacter lanyuensis]|uniref:Membrane protein n=1 Tax=Gemmobacter lanyuensis TaxID=1054497 RepID=A0A918MHP7_9RHOB|nr:efflux RND transporter periplasmic adaptor subunit [Gemmobacter lanyuensis]GGW26662.1 membrane protein [Gemmobacter lanyuensis]
MRISSIFVVTGLLAPLLATAAVAETLTLAPVPMTDWKAVYGRIEARDRIPARARLGGTLVELAVSEGDVVAAGRPLARIVDEKLTFQLVALESQKAATQAQLANAEADLKRGEELKKQGVTTEQRLDALRTQVDVLRGQLSALSAQADVIGQQQTEGAVLAPVGGRVLDVPVAKGAVVMPGETVATLGGGGTFLRLAVPERHATALDEGATIRIEGAEGAAEGRLVKVYPLIEAGRVIADVEVADLSDRFVDARVLVRLPTGSHPALMVPQTAILTRNGLDFVAIEGADGPSLQLVVPGQTVEQEGKPMVEILTGLAAGDRILTQAPTDQGASHD